MRTRCPYCATSFRVTPDQLKIRQGQVRCGKCREVFDALAALEEEAILVPTPPSAELEARPVTVELPDDDHNQRMEPSFGASLGPEHPQPHEEPRPVPAEPVTEQPAAVPLESEDAPPAIVEPPAEVIPESIEQPIESTLPQPDEFLIELPAEALSEEPVEAAAETLPEELAETPAEEFAAGPVGERVEEPGDRNAKAEGSEEGTEAPADELQEAALPEAPQEQTAEPETEVISAPPVVLYEDEHPRPRRWPWAVGSLLAIGLLALQALLYFRTELALQYPESKPALAALCGTIGCEIELPHKIEHISIETSDLVPDKSGHLQLAATLHNRAPFAQAWPHLELTLTDARDRALLRRALAPAEYLQPQLPVADGFSARSEHAVQLLVETTDVPAVGYRLYVFYP